MSVTGYPSQAVQAARLHSAGLVTFDLNTKELIDHEVDYRIHSLERYLSGTPILTLSSRLGAPKKVNGPVFHMFEVRPRKNYFSAAATFTSSDATITIGAGDVGNLLNGYYIVDLDTREMMQVSGAPATALPVTRGVGSVAAAASSGAADEFMVLSYLGKEGDSNFTDLTRQPTMKFNYIGELQRIVGETQYQRAVKTLGSEGGAWGWARMDAVEQQRMELEKGTYFLQRAKRYDANGKATYIPNGLDAMSTENEYTFGGSVTEAKVLDALEDRFRYGPKVCVALCAPTTLRKVNEAIPLATSSGVATTRRINDDSIPRRMGTAIQEYQAPGGKVNFISVPLFQDAVSTGANSLQHGAFLVSFDPEDNAQGFHYKTLGGELGGWFRWIPNVHTPGTRGRQDQLVTNFGMSIPFAECLQRWIDAA